MSPEFYKALHLVGVILLFFSMGGMIIHAMTASPEPSPDDASKKLPRKLLMSFHGVALVLLLVAGFGGLAKMGIKGGPPGWAWGKIVLWGVLAAAPALIKRKPDLGKVLWFVMPALGAIAASLAVFKPGG